MTVEEIVAGGDDDHVVTISEADMRDAAFDPVAQAARRAVAPALRDAFDRAGRNLWATGEIFGGDRAAGRSPFQYGDDAAVACGLAALTAGKLCRGAIALLEEDNRYSAGALVRQLVEIQFLVWCFAAEQSAAAGWLRSTDAERSSKWRPAALRKRAGKQFSEGSYWSHCELGGHLTPVRSTWLLTDNEVDRELMWPDLIGHAVHVWDGLAVAAKEFTEFKIDIGEYLALEPPIPLVEALEQWRAVDYFPVVGGEL